MKNLKITPFFSISIVGLLCLTVLFLYSLYDIIVNPGISTISFINCVVYFITDIIALFTLLNPQKKTLVYVGLCILCFYDVLKKTEITSILFFAIIIILLIIENFYTKKTIVKVIATFIAWTILLISLCINSQGDVKRIVYFSVISIFLLGALYTIFQLNTDKTQPIPSTKLISTNDDQSQLSLTDNTLNLTPRQMLIINDTLTEYSPNKMLADILNISESSVKRELKELYTLYGVNSRKELKTMLINSKDFF